MDYFVKPVVKLLQSSDYQPLFEQLKKQNQQVKATESTKLIVDDDDSDINISDGEDSETDDIHGQTDKELAKNIFNKLGRLFAYTSFQDKFLLLLGLISTIVHAATFPILAILFGKITNAYIVHTLLEFKNTTNAHNVSHPKIGTTGQFALSFLSKVTSGVDSAMNMSVISPDKIAGGSSYFGDMMKYTSNGTETIEDFANYVAEFSANYTFLGIAVFFASFIQIVTWECVAENQLYRIKQKYICQLQRQEMTWFSQRAAGNLVLKMADDCERYREGVGQKFVLVVEYVIILLFGAGIGLLTNVKLTLVFLTCAPFIVTKLLVLWIKMADTASIAKKENANAGKIASEVITDLKTVAAFSGERRELRRYKSALMQGSKASESREIFIGVGIGGIYFVMYAFYAISLWYSVNLLAEGAITAGEIYTVFFSLTICAFALGSLLPHINGIADSYASMKALDAVLDSVPNIDPFSLTGDRPKYFTGKIRILNLTFAYPGKEKKPVFSEFSLELPETGLIGIVGYGSSGKSTLVNLLLRFYDPQLGQIKLDSFDLRTLNVRWLREQISIVDHKADLRNTTILDNMRGHKKDIVLRDVIKAAKCALAHNFITQLPNGYMTKLETGKELSDAQRIKICIAKCLLTNPRILILDDALPALDNDEMDDIQENLAAYRKNTTTVILGNKLAPSRKADVIFLLQNGRVIEKGTDAELVELKKVYYRMLVQENQNAEEEAEEEEIQPIRRTVKIVKLTEKKGGRRGRRRDAEKDTDVIKEMPSFAKIISILPEKSHAFLLGTAGCILGGLVVPLLAICLGKIIDMFVGDRDNLFASGIYWVEFLTCLAVLAGIGYCMRMVFIGLVGEQLSVRMCLSCYESILRQPISWFDQEANSPQYIYARLSSDIPFIRNAVGPRLGTAISAILTMLFGLVVAGYYSWKLALIASLTIPVIFVGFYLQRTILRKSHLKLSFYRRRLLELTSRIIKNIEDIQKNSKALAQCRRAEHCIQPALIDGQTRSTVYAFVYAASECLMFLIFGSTFRVSAELVRTGQISMSNLFIVFFVLTFGSLSLGQAMSFIPEFFKAHMSSTFLFELMDMKSPVDPYDETGQRPIVKGEIEFRDVVFSYPMTPNAKEIAGVSLTVPAGSSLGIVGPHGSGKSALLTLLTRFYDPGSGQILIDGVNIKDFNLKHLRDNIGYVDVDPKLFDITVKQNIAYGYLTDADDEEMSQLVEKATKLAGAEFILDELPLQYDTKCGEHGRNLNGEQRQAVAMARIVIRNPPILLFDDPTRLLDAEDEQRVQNTLLQITKGRTTIIVSNSYYSIKNCEYIAVMNKGKVTEFGKQKDLLKSQGVYYKFMKDIGVRISATLE